MARERWLGRALAAACVLATAGYANAQTPAIPGADFKVVGTWAGLSMYENNEKPFWQKRLAEKSGGAVKGQITPQTELGLKGFEIVRLLKLGVFDFAHGVLGYVADDAVVEAADLSGIAQDIDTAKKVIDAYRPIMDNAFEKKYGVKLLAMWPLTSQAFFCRDPVAKIEDLKGKKIRVYSTSLGDFVEGVGGISTTVAFAETTPALQKGVVDCGVTGMMPAYDSKWHEVARYLYTMRIGWGVNFLAVNPNSWNKLDPRTRAFLTDEISKFETEVWATMRKEDKGAIVCNTNTGPCEYGKPGTMNLVEPSAADLKARDKILTDFVLARWGKRCGAECVKNFNDTVGKAIGINAPMPN